MRRENIRADSQQDRGAQKNLTLAEVQEVLSAALQPYREVIFAILYGSVVEGSDYRDIDLALFVNRERTSSRDAWDFAFRLAEQLQKKLSCPVDVCILNEAPLAFRYHFCQGVPVLVRDQTLFDEFIERTRDEYWDFQPIALQYLRELR